MKTNSEISKDVWVWQIRQVCPSAVAKPFDEDVFAAECEEYAQLLAAGGWDRVYVKIIEGVALYQPDYMLQPFIQAVQAQDIECWGWGWLRDRAQAPKTQAYETGQHWQRLGLTGYIINGEAPMKTWGAQLTKEYLDELLKWLPSSVPVGFSSYRVPSLHTEIAWRTIFPYVSVMMPQVYWLWAHDPVPQLERTFKEYRDLGWSMAIWPVLPLFPEARTIGGVEERWEPTDDDILDAVEWIENHNISSTSFYRDGSGGAWSLDSGADGVAWDWATDPAPPPPPVEPPPPDDQPNDADILLAIYAKLDGMHTDLVALVTGVDYISDVLDGWYDDEPEEPLPPNDGVVGVLIDASPRANARCILSFNAAGFPIMQIYPSDTAPVSERVQFDNGDIVSVVRDPVRADGGDRYYRLADTLGDGGEPLYLREVDVSLSA